MYGKLIDGVLNLAPKNYIKDGKTICNFDKSITLLTREGYKEIILTEPDYDKSTHVCTVSGYEDRGDYIKCIYILKEKELNRFEATDLALSFLDINLESEVQVLSDEQSLQVKSLFPKWEASIGYMIGDKINYNGTLYKVIKTHVSQPDLTPDISPNLFIEVVVNREAEGDTYNE